MGNLLLGCPPEILKALMVNHVPMPDTIVVPHTTIRHHSSQVCLEFPFYHFLFIQQGLMQGRRLRVLCQEAMIEPLKEMLRMTLVGPNLKEFLGAEKKLGLHPKTDKALAEQIVKETEKLALKGKDGKILPIEKLVEFIPFEIGDEVVAYSSEWGDPDLSVACLGENHYKITCDEEFECRLEITEPQEPSYKIKAKPVTDKEKDRTCTKPSVRLLGVSEGFDPREPANGLLFYVGGKWIMWDSPVYLRSHLEKIGIDFDQIDALFISHVHEDHLDVAQTIDEGRKTPLYSTPEIFHSLLVKLQAVKGCSYEEAMAYYDFHPLYAGVPFEIFSCDAEVFYSLHSIPALGLKLSLPNGQRVFISGDSLPIRKIEELKKEGVIDQQRLDGMGVGHEGLSRFERVFVDAGGGMIHGDPEDYFDVKSQVEYMHTGRELHGLPADHEKVHQGQRIML